MIHKHLNEVAQTFPMSHHTPQNKFQVILELEVASETPFGEQHYKKPLGCRGLMGNITRSNLQIWHDPHHSTSLSILKLGKRAWHQSVLKFHTSTWTLRWGYLLCLNSAASSDRYHICWTLECHATNCHTWKAASVSSLNWPTYLTMFHTATL